jgi:diadenosine tetraphosphate (Ap4A) HIT family hydrolase
MPIDATQPYDDNNIFARLLRGEIPSKTVYEDEFALALHDINPLAPTHLLVVPKGSYVSWDDGGLVQSGYRLLANVGLNSGQEVPHLHVHVFGGRPLGPMLAR